MSHVLQRSTTEIYEQLNRAAHALDAGTRYPGMSYEEGVHDALSWVIGSHDDEPLPDDDRDEKEDV